MKPRSPVYTKEENRFMKPRAKSTQKIVNTTIKIINYNLICINIMRRGSESPMALVV